MGLECGSSPDRSQIFKVRNVTGPQGTPRKELSPFVSSVHKISFISSWTLFLILDDAKAMLCYVFLTEIVNRVKKQCVRTEVAAADLIIRC
jgi:hypothetical protein